MKHTLRNTLMTLTMLSTGFFLLSSEAASASFLKKLEKKPAVTSNEDLKQFPEVNLIQNEVTEALNIHKKAISMPEEKEQIEKQYEEVEKYNEILRRLEANKRCNINLLNEHFYNGDAMWRNISAYAEDSAATLLAQSSDSLGATEASGQLNDLQNSVDSGDLSDDGSSFAAGNSSSSQYSNINGDTTDEEANAIISQGQNSAQNQADQASEGEMDLGEAEVYGKVRWDVGYAILKDLYRNPREWGNLKKNFTPWVDQKYVYDQYLKNFYKEIQDHYVFDILKPFPSKPKLTSGSSYLPGDYYQGSIPRVTVSNIPYNPNTATADDKWCGQTHGKKNICPRVNKGALYAMHLQYVAALEDYELKPDVPPPSFEPPYLPQSPLPPWRESVYIMSVEKELPEFASELPEPWYLVTQDIDNYTSHGELSELVQKHGGTIRYRPGDYNSETLAIKKDIFGRPKLPIPLTANRISSYLSLLAARDEQKPIRDKALARIKEMNEEYVKSLQELGCVIPNADTFDLRKSSDVSLAKSELRRVKGLKISSARQKIEVLQGRYGLRMLSSIRQLVKKEKKTLDALQVDTAFLVKITRDNASEIHSLILKAIADAVANEAYKANISNQMEEAPSVPAVGCPI